MKKLVVDASVAIKWFVPEIHSAAASRLLDPELLISAPDLIGPEFGNMIWKKLRRQEITPEEAAEILTAFPSVGVEILPSGILLLSAFELAVALDRTVYDCLYLALAVAQGCALVTADQRFYDSVIESPLASHIRWIEDEW
jgi:predicted nucleic acid-binding protein